jgi:hypothetical protein
LRNAANLLALGVVFGAIGKGGQHGNGEDGLLLLQVHGRALSTVNSREVRAGGGPGAGVSVAYRGSARYQWLVAWGFWWCAALRATRSSRHAAASAKAAYDGGFAP